MVTSVRGHQGYFGFRYLICEHTTDTFALGMHLQHDARRSRAVHPKELFQDIDDELHGGVIVVEQHHLISGRLLRLGLGFFDCEARAPVIGAFGFGNGHWHSL